MTSKIGDIQKQLERAVGRSLAPEPPEPPTRSVAPSREGKIHIGAYLSPDFKASLRLVQARTGKNIEGLLADALNELFRAHNAPVIEHVKS
jgi:hypothetical protein